MYQVTCETCLAIMTYTKPPRPDHRYYCSPYCGNRDRMFRLLTGDSNPLTLFLDERRKTE